MNRNNIDIFIYHFKEFIKGYSLNPDYTDLFIAYNNYNLGIETKYDYFFKIITKILNFNNNEFNKWLNKINILSNVPNGVINNSIKQYFKILLKHANKYNYDLGNNAFIVNNKLYILTLDKSDDFEFSYIVSKILDNDSFDYNYLKNRIFIVQEINGNGKDILIKYGYFEKYGLEYINNLDNKQKEKLKVINFIKEKDL